MKRTILVCVGLCLAMITPALAKDKAKMKEEARALIEQAIQVSNLHGPGSGPYELEATETMPSRHQEVKYVVYSDASSYREDATFNGQTEESVRIGADLWKPARTHIPVDMFWESRSIANPLLVLRDALKEKVTGVIDLKSGGSDLKCVKSIEGVYRRHEMCFDPTTGALLVSKTSWPSIFPPGGSLFNGHPQGGTDIVTFGNYESFRGVLIPMQMQVIHDGAVDTSWKITNIAPLKTPEAPSLFAKPAGAEEWPYCDNMSFVGTDPIMLPGDSLSKLRSLKDVALQLTISHKGKVTEGYVISEQKRGDGGAFLKILSRHHFQPALCNGKPIRGELILALYGPNH